MTTAALVQVCAGEAKRRISRSRFILRGSIVEVLQPRCSLEWTRARRRTEPDALARDDDFQSAFLGNFGGGDMVRSVGCGRKNETVKFGTLSSKREELRFTVVLPVYVRN